MIKLLKNNINNRIQSYIEGGNENKNFIILFENLFENYSISKLCENCEYEIISAINKSKMKFQTFSNQISNNINDFDLNEDKNRLIVLSSSISNNIDCILNNFMIQIKFGTNIKLIADYIISCAIKMKLVSTDTINIKRNEKIPFVIITPDHNKTKNINIKIKNKSKEEKKEATIVSEISIREFIEDPVAWCNENIHIYILYLNMNDCLESFLKVI